MQTKYFYLVLIFLVGFISCSDDLTVNNPNQPTTPNNPQTNNPDIDFPDPTEDLTTSISGAVTDNNGEAIVDALVTCVSCQDRLTTTTDEMGGFSFLNVTNNGDQAYLSVRSSSKFDGYRRFPVLVDRQNYTSIILRDKIKQASLSAQTEGVATLSSGAQLSMPADGVVDLQGQSYSGDYDVYLSWIDPASPQLAETMMGDLSAIDAEGELVGLSTFGMIQVELEAPDGSSLNLGNGAQAELIFPVPQELMGIAPEEIPLWTYDETNGYWVEEGSAQLVDGNYVGMVSHFSTWNVDAKVNPINLSGEIRINTRETEVGLSFFEIRLSGNSFNSVGGWLCNDGSFTFNNVPGGESFTIEIIDYCGAVVETLEVGPYTEDTVLDPIYISDGTDLNDVLIQGNAFDCDGNALSNGKVSVFIGNRPFSFPVDEQGNFLFAVTLCSGATANLQIVNLDDFSTSAEILITDLNENFLLDDINLCEENEEYFYFEWNNLDSIITPEWNQLLITQPDLLWYSKQDDTYLFQCISDELSFEVTTFGFSKNLELNQYITGNPEDGFLLPDGNGGFEPFIIEWEFEFYFSDIGDLNADGFPEYIQGSFTSTLGGGVAVSDFKGSFRLKYQ